MIGAAPSWPIRPYPGIASPSCRPRPPSPGQRSAPSPAAHSAVRWRESGASASANCGPSSGPLPVMRRRYAAEDAVRPPRPAASPQRPSPGFRPRVRSPPHRCPRPRPSLAPSWCPTCPSVPVPSIIRSSQAHPTRVSALSGRAVKTRIRAVMRHHRREATVSGAGFPLPFNVPALASRVILFPLRS